MTALRTLGNMTTFPDLALVCARPSAQSSTPGAALDAAAGGRHEGLHRRRVRGASELLRLRLLALQRGQQVLAVMRSICIFARPEPIVDMLSTLLPKVRPKTGFV